MDVTIDRKSLATAATAAARIAATTTSLPILRNTLVEAGPDGLRLAATDLERGVEIRLTAEVVTDGQVTIPAAEFAQILANLPEGVVRLRLETGAAEGSGRVVISSRKSDYRLAFLPPEATCSLPEIETLAEVEIEAPELAAGLAGCAWANDTKEQRVNYNSVRLLPRSGRLELEVATNAFAPRRLLNVQRASGEAGYTCNLPAESVQELLRCLPASGPVRIEAGGSQIAFRFGNTRFTSGLREGKWPNTDRMFAKAGENPESVEFDREDCLAVLKRLGVYWGSTDSKVVRLEFGGGACRLMAWSDLGHAAEEFEAVGTAEIVLGQNAQMLKSALEAMRGERVKVAVKSPLDATLYRPSESDDSLTLLMPMDLAGMPVPEMEMGR